MLENNPDPNELSRVELLSLAHSLNISDADVMTRAELRAAIDKARKPEPRPPEQPVTWVSVARRLLASIVEQGLNLPDAAALIRGDTKLSTPPKAPPPVATVTLARIYAAQGHLERALRTLDEVLRSDPDHQPALQLRAQLVIRLDEQRRQAAAASAEAHESEPPPSAVDVRDGGAETSVAAGAEATGAPAASPAPAPELLIPAPTSEALHQGSLLSGGTTDAPSIGAPIGAAPELVVHPPAEVPIHVALADAPTDVPGAHAGAVAILPADAPAAGESPASSAASTPTPGEVPAAAPAPEREAARRAARPPGLVVIETAVPTAYVYWELGAPQRTALAAAPCWISVVTHTPTKHGSERRERRVPVYQARGALRLEGVPRQAIVRAKLAREEAADARPLAVAGSVRAQSLAGKPPPSALPLAELEPRFIPHDHANPRALAQRAALHLENASPVYL